MTQPVRPSGFASIRSLALAAVVLMVLVILASAWLRLAGARPGCVDWPSCRAAGLPVPQATAHSSMTQPAVLGAVRLLHRLAATTALLVAVALVWRTRGAGSPGRDDARALLAVGLGLSVLGVGAGASFAPPVVIGNLLGGFAMLALAWRLLRPSLASWQVPSTVALPWALPLTLAWWTVQAAAGAVSGLGAGQGVAVLHIVSGLGAGLLGMVSGWLMAARGWPQEGRGLVLLGLAQPALGMAAAVSGAGLSAVLAHNVLAAAGIVLMAGSLKMRALARSVPQA